jgi:dihydroorotase
VEKVKARIAIVDPNAEWTIEAKNMHTKCGWTPYEGWTVRGWVERVVQ